VRDTSWNEATGKPRTDGKIILEVSCDDMNFSIADFCDGDTEPSFFLIIFSE
jgi:hypothetical protein